ncbi:hypothetical protein Mapa_008149 [Marchantia paleacea]|nr:hypothetical protein Mapa_008149 [Marchantia paleacea]
MELTMAVATGLTTSSSLVSSSRSVVVCAPSTSFSSVSVQNGLRTSFLSERRHLFSAGPLRSDNVSERIAVHSSGAPIADDSTAVAEGSNAPSEDSQESSPRRPSMDRRELMGKAVTLLMSSIALPAMAASVNSTEDGFMLYQDETDKYSLLVPQEWAKGEGETAQRKVTAFYPESGSAANVNIVITGLGADYTQLGSFGNADMFAENLVNSLDRAWQRPPGQKATLIDDSYKNGMYYVEYTVQKPGEAKRHLLSVVGIANNGWINRLYTVTAQYWEDDADKYKANLKKIVSSFKLTG